MKHFPCTRCGQRVFFDNQRCESCGATLGYVPAERRMVAFDAAADGPWTRHGDGGAPMRPCANYTAEDVCNWMVPVDDGCPLCLSCRTSEVIPNLEKPENRLHWYRLERAKRRLFDTLLALKLPIRPKSADPEHGLAFHFLEDTSPEERVLTGHDHGLITLNVAEADDAQRERMRAAMHEPYRTLLGHFRHESGHYYWDRLVADTRWIEPFRALFGDERADYGEALARHYESPCADWPARFVSVYASSHPWEDWAECWAHYLHMIDGLETAAAWGVRLESATPGQPPAVPQPLTVDSGAFENALITQWMPVAQMVNGMNRSLGVNDPYPFVIPPPVVEKLAFVHRVVRTHALEPDAPPATKPQKPTAKAGGRKRPPKAKAAAAPAARNAAALG